MNVIELLGTAAGVGFLAGIRLYATVFCLGLLIRTGVLPLTEQFEPVTVLASLPVLITSAVLAVAEFVSDKVPWFDSIWDTVHTFIRPLGAAALAFTAAGSLDPGLKTALVLVTGGVAVSSHAAKAATRVAANQSPEPFSNWALSIGEDLFVPLGLWLTIHFPLIVLGLTAAFVIAVVIMIRVVTRFVRKRWFGLTGRPGLASKGSAG
jgi:hypothetical protein